MTSKKMWFGTAEKMQWVRCPATNIQRNRLRWTGSDNYLNGGGYVENSDYSHLEYKIDWNLMESNEASKIMSYFDGTWGNGLIRFVDPFAAKSNILPLHWSVPRLTATDAPSLLSSGARPAVVTAASGNANYPVRSAQYTLTGTTNPSVYIPVPPGYNFYLGARGAATGTAAVSAIADVGSGAEVRRNLAISPRGVGTLGGYGTQTITPNVVATGNPDGITTATRISYTSGQANPGLRFTSANLAAGTTYTISAWIYVESQTVASGYGLGIVSASSETSRTLAVGVWTRVSWTVTPGSAGVPGFRLNSSAAAGAFLVTGMLVEAGSVVGSVFDGSWSQDPNLSPAWTSAANASASTLSYRTTASLSGQTETAQTTMMLPDPGGVTIRLSGTGALTLNSMTATIGKATPTYTEFRPGEGNSGVRFDGTPQRTGYSSALDLESVSATFKEVGAWE